MDIVILVIPATISASSVLIQAQRTFSRIIADIILLPVELSKFLSLCLLLFFKIIARPLPFPFTSYQIRTNN